ncbi:MAG: HEPN domain-containing protein [Theionarchaea archaeon]|nr:HEPN domain-containing protein [Theionarchaea archaeon]
MRKEAELWIEDSDYDLATAEDLLEKKRFNYVVFLARQSVEKLLKAAHLIVLQEGIPREHNLAELARSCFDEIPIDIMEGLICLNPHYTITRYVDASLGIPSDVYDESSAKEALEKAKEIRKWIKKNL